MLNANALELLAAIVDSSDDGIVSKTPDGVITSWNRSAERIFGYSSGEAVGQSIAMLFPPDRLAEEGRLIREIAAGRHVEPFETERIRKDGQRIPVTVSLSPVRDPEGRVIGASTIVRDISERTRLQRQAARATAELDRVLSSLREGFVTLDRDLRYTFANDAALRLVGLSREAIIGRAPWEVLPPGMVEAILPRIRAAIETGEELHYELHDPGADRWYENRLYPSTEGASLFFTDITARRQAEQALRESRDVLALAMRAGQMGVWSRNLVTDEVWWSQELEEIVGLPPGAFAGTHTGFLALIHENDRATVEDAVAAAIAAGHDYHVEFRYRHAIQGWRWMEGRGRTIRDESGRPVFLYGLGIDITQRKAFEDALAAARDAAEAANRAKDEFMAMLGHELRNPLSPILTALQLMKLRGTGETERERTVIERQVTHLTRLVDDLLDVSRIARGKVELRVQRLELAEVVARAVEVASPLLEERMHVLALDVPRTGLPVDADPARLSQVISNLLTNAAKYTPPGGHVSVAASSTEGEVVLRVRDTGMGIPPEVLPRVFNLFVQGRQALDRAHGGLGLGLAIVRSLVERHRGRVEAHSAGADRGSEFVVRLPLAAGTAPPVAAEAPVATGAVPPARARVLVVDDNEDAADMLALGLRLRGYDARVAHDGPGALRLAGEFRPDIAFLDIGLPVMDGYELAARLRERPDLPQLRLVAVTGYGQESDRQRTRAAGFEQHLVKPIDLDTLVALVADSAPDPA